MGVNEIIKRIFNEDILKQLDAICDSFDITDNNERADAMMDVLEFYDFKELGCGTNRLCVEHPEFPQYAIKIALDGRGIIDNNAERALCRQEDLKPFVTTTYDNNGMILLAEKIEVMGSEDYDYYKSEIMRIMKTLAPKYILNDIGPESFRNFGIKYDLSRDGRPVIIDYAYLTKIEMAAIKRCTGSFGEPCGGKLAYTDNFKYMRCVECGKRYDLDKVAGPSFVDPLIEEGYYIPDVNE